MQEVDYEPPKDYRLVKNQTRLLFIMDNICKYTPFDFEDMYNQFECFNYKSPFFFVYDFFFFQKTSKKKLYHCVTKRLGIDGFYGFDFEETEITTLQQFYGLYYHYTEPHVNEQFFVAIVEDGEDERFIFRRTGFVEDELYSTLIGNAFEMADLIMEKNGFKHE